MMDALSKNNMTPAPSHHEQKAKAVVQDNPSHVSEEAAALGRQHFLSGFYCAESVLKAMADIHGIKDPNIPKIATGFCGGISRTSGMCGALAGGIMALGLLCGRSTPTDPKEQCYTLTYHLVNLFREKFGSTQCTKLLDCDISTAEGARKYVESDLNTSVCTPITSQATALVEEIYARRDSLRHPLL
jgi:C_GCAxxG_C_C family probable redox protein